MKTLLYALASGILLGIGLVAGHLTRAETILGFFDLHRWNPTMLLFSMGAVPVMAIAHRIALRRGQGVNPSRHIDAPLLLGAAIFGAGWGLAGICPGPAVAGLATVSARSLVFFVAMAIGMRLQARLSLPRGS